jgi:dUTP pyrophosphatase
MTPNFEIPHAALKITRMYPDVKMPRKATFESIGADVYAYLKTESGRNNKLVIPPGTTRMVSTGIVALAQPPFSILVCSRSGLAAQRALFVTNSPGVIDPDYRGEIKILLHNAGVQTQWIEHGDRIAQLVLVPIPIPDISESEIDIRHIDSERGEAGFGSTGT